MNSATTSSLNTVIVTDRSADYSVRLLLADGTLAPAGGEWADTLDDAREIAAAWGHCGIWAPGARAGDGSEPVETTALLPS